MPETITFEGRSVYAVCPEEYDEMVAELERLRAAQPAVPDVPAALGVLSAAMRAEPDYAWTWHCNVAMVAQDAGAPHDKANVWAAEFMRRAFGVDTLTRVKAEFPNAGPSAQPKEPQP